MTKKIELIENLLSKGSDERIFQDEYGLTKYGISLVNTDIFNRGSCTASPATTDDILLMDRMIKNNRKEGDWLNMLDERTLKIKSWLNNEGENSFEVFYAPSGTDLFYYPIIISKLLYPQKKTINIITCKEELGSGTPYASEAIFFSNYNQFGNKIIKGGQIIENRELKTIFFKARSDNGHILNHEEQIKEIVQNNPDKSIIINLVYGSKSGISDNIRIIDKIEADNVIWSIDMCQLRHKQEVIRSFIKKNSMVMITGSKFYQAPPFCAAMLIPNKHYNRIAETKNWSKVIGFKNIFSTYDLPEEVRSRSCFNEKINISGMLRWALAIKEINEYNKIEDKLAENTIRLWNKALTEAIKSLDYFELMPNQEQTNKSIISFRVKTNEGFLDNQQLKSLHKEICRTDYSLNYDFKTLFVGQPVAYRDKSFLRIAIGSKNVREFVKNNEMVFKNDKEVLLLINNKLEEIYGNHQSNS